MIPMFDASRQVASLNGALEEAVIAVLQQGSFVLGEELAEFEKEFAVFCESKFAVGVASGTDAIALSLRACKVEPGDKVLMPAMTAIPTAMAVVQAGAIPVFCDVDPDSGLMDPVDARERIEKGIRAILPVHLYGRPVPMDAILQIAKEHEFQVIEDAAQAHGATWNGRSVGTFGTCGAFSFYPTKNLSCAGDGGMVITRDDWVYQRLLRLRNYGQIDRYQAEETGINSRLDDIQAAILSVKLPYLAQWNQRRNEIAKEYIERLSDLEIDLPVEVEGQVFHLFTILTPHRTKLSEHLHKLGVASQVHYPLPLHLQKAFAHLEYEEGELPASEKFAQQVLSLPLFPEMTESEIDQVIEAVRSFFEGD